MTIHVHPSGVAATEAERDALFAAFCRAAARRRKPPVSAEQVLWIATEALAVRRAQLAAPPVTLRPFPQPHATQIECEVA